MIEVMTEFAQYDPKVVLAVGAHADDIDYGASGSVAKWAADGAEVHYLVITDGSKGSADTSMTREKVTQTRQAEQQAAAKVLGAKEVHFLNYEDGVLEVTQALKKDIVRVIRQVRPDTVVAIDPTFIYSSELGIINHPDHRAAGQATLDAVYPLARDYLSFPELLHEGLEPHKVAHVLLMHAEKQNYYVDISTVLEQKLEGLKQHASQFPNIDEMTKQLEQQAATMGSKIGARYAEGFVRIDCMP